MLCLFFFCFLFLFFFLLFDQWLTPLWQSPGPWCQILYVCWLLQGVHHPPDQQLRARAGTGVRAWARLRGLWTGTHTVQLQIHSGREGDWWWWWWWCRPQHWGTSQHFRVWVSVCEGESKKSMCENISKCAKKLQKQRGFNSRASQRFYH